MVRLWVEGGQRHFRGEGVAGMNSDGGVRIGYESEVE